ncbi:MAG: Crp/Fnr family transcriptional regulator [Acidobacteria bacterium]|uniref:Crp/Fnr family transcriptional regulator n=1 Tax=Candidatus Polarisedimenticola svalbardensis TaxID=2886004 RepID=A0A8J6Y1F3_9BACT|nr:Crp/Fnr family transcriptional regulator [Candidatus Polarisedimenticola svalbardensis]
MLPGMKPILEILGQVSFLEGAGEPVLRELAGLMDEKIYLRNEVLFLDGDSPKGLFVVRHGAVKIYKIGDKGREQILEIEGPGRSVAELPLFDGRPYPASAAALEDAAVLILPASTFHRLLDRHPEISRAVIASIAGRLRKMVALVEEVSLKAVRERLSAVFLEMAGDDDTFDLTWTNQEIAARIGTVREIVSRTMARMAHDGAIQMDGRRVIILDRDRL